MDQSGHKAFLHPFHPYATTSVAADSTVVTTMVSSTHMPSNGDRIPPSGLEIRARKASRKRSRASRRAPTTLLSTDTANFRAMVQQFTGVPTRPYVASCASEGPSTLDFGYGREEPVCQTDGLQQQLDYYKNGPTQRQGEALGFMMSEENMENEPLRHQGDGLFLDVLGRHLMLPPGHRADTYFC
ncbi:hypothetical protein HPP92_027582 [Vanilla planifolia]|uniref:VQ domain-containing protein n=1 Tax=Vanilla planifolia TaxID=51239 RepID=A0A835R4T8_VANPL|nr:hypothetical protein HPP92_027582 [Vanilla planifolia]KAG0480152.1 hypothetical protein HPP92_011010 [Vanilla planifolia]